MRTAVLRDRPVFICGHPKSGTSLLRSIFDSHPQLIVYPEETIFFRRFLPNVRNLSTDEQLLLAEKELIHIFQWNSKNPVANQTGFPDRDYSTIGYDQVSQKLHHLVKEKNDHPGDLLSAAIIAFGDVSRQLNEDTLWWIEKSPYNEYYARQIFEWWPEARCIHIVRDPRDNFASYLRKHPDWTAEFFSQNWLRSTHAGIQNQKTFGAEKYKIIRYEDLTSSPQDYLKELAAFLEIRWDDTLAEPTRAGKRWRGNSMFANQFQNISRAPIARWKENLNKNDAAVVSIMTQPVLESLRYSNTNEFNFLKNSHPKARWRVVTWPIRRHFRQRQGSETTR